MTSRSVVNSSFTIEREYRVSPDRLFAAWADPDDWLTALGTELSVGSTA